jgi:hypothetical protein
MQACRRLVEAEQRQQPSRIRACAAERQRLAF